MVLTAEKVRAMVKEPGKPEKFHVEEWNDDVYIKPLPGLIVTRLGFMATQVDGEDTGLWLELVPDILRECVLDADGNSLFPTVADVQAITRENDHMVALMSIVGHAIEMTDLNPGGLERVEGN